MQFTEFPKIPGSSPINFGFNNVSTGVSIDTFVPANSRPLPVSLLDSSGNPTAIASEATLSAMSLKLPASLGAKTTANSLSVSLPTDLAPLLVSQNGAWSVSVSNLPATQAVSGTVGISNFPATQAINGTVTVSNLPVTQQVGGTVTVNGSVSVSAMPAITGSVSVSNLPATQAVSAASLPLPTGAATASNQTALSAQIPATLGQKTMANSLAIALASDQSPVATKAQGKSVVAFVRNDYSSTTVYNNAYTQLIASLGSAVTELEIFDSSGNTMILAVGGAGSEVDTLLVMPGGNGRIPVSIASGSRVSIKAAGAATSAVGEIDINFYS